MDARAIFEALRSGQIDAKAAKERLISVRESGTTGETGAHHPQGTPRLNPEKAALPAGKHIAIVGLNGRFPMAADVNEFWLNLAAGADCISEIPLNRWKHSDYYSEDKEAEGKAYCKWGGFISGVDEFDPAFFHISPREAELMDPQERKFLEVVWGLLEQAGYTRHRIKTLLNREVGVFVGAMYLQYHSFDADLSRKAMVALGSYGSIANRVSYFFDFQGPSMAVDSMCSSGALAIDLACQSLLSGGCRMAIAGATNLSIHPYKYVALSQTRMLASDPSRRSFSCGDGFIPGEVVGAVLLKRIVDAEVDHDPIFAVIKSSSVRHKGRSEGFTVPNASAQASLLADHLASHGIKPETINYVECSASGSQAADGAEFAALREIFTARDPNYRCAIGSAKANIGHTEAASGLVQLTKVVQQLVHQKLPASIMREPQNPEIQCAGTPLYIVNSLSDWEPYGMPAGGIKEEFPRRALVHSIGAGGTICHMVVEEYRGGAKPCLPRSAKFPPVFCFSSHDWRCLLKFLSAFRAFLDRNPELSLSDIAYTLHCGREEMKYRVAVVANEMQKLKSALNRALEILNQHGSAKNAGNIFWSEAEGPGSDLQTGGGGVPHSPSIRSAEEANDYYALADKWVRGEAINWADHYDCEITRIVPSIPVSILASRPYWLGRRWERAEAGLEIGRGVRNGRNGSKPEPLSGQLAAFMAASLRKTLAMEDEEVIDPNGSFISLGVDSVALMRLGREIADHWAVAVKGRDFLQHRTIAALSEYLARVLEDRREQVL